MMSKWVRSVNLQISQLVIVQDGDQDRSYYCNNKGANWIEIVDGNTVGKVSPEEEEELQGLYKQFLTYKDNPIEEYQPKKLCKDCKHLSEIGLHLWCVSPQNGIDLVSGGVNNRLVDTARKLEKYCGPDAKWFVQKEAEVQSKQRKWWKLWSS